MGQQKDLAFHEEGQGWTTPPFFAPSNRLTAGEISMFYDSKNLANANAELLATVRAKKSVDFTAAAWSPSRPLRMVNLCIFAREFPVL